ncbi:type II secretion system F family protein [Zobellella maritima]|uniref:type II secretion system F family protein n=1 Tax=Zobellella maritima TaxID=2059725 RepID=UPI000E2FF988|nr:type II secretion system F family protein [Zobellella maritima]
MNWMFICASLLVGSSLLLLLLILHEQKARREVARRLGKGAGHEKDRLLREIGSSRLVQRGLSIDGETRLLLDRLGWRKSRQKSLFLVIQLGLPLLLLLLRLFTLFSSEPVTHPWVMAFFALGVGYIIPKRILARAVKKRQTQLAEDVASALPLLRTLFEVGMIVEQALRVLATEGRHILPVLSDELHQLLQRVDAGLELKSELRRTANLMDVDELTDCFVVLEQMLQQGSGAMTSLLSMKKLLDERRMTHLQGKVSKMSAKMSIVMVSFLFPALLIVLAGPGFIAIVRAIGDMG